MVDTDRIERLRVMARELEREAPSRERDALLRKTRSRIAEVEADPVQSDAFTRRLARLVLEICCPGA